ncbi:MAG: hypothetical protein ACRENJ_12455 [Candidatus Eiseniibacteriota bacterium]
MQLGTRLRPPFRPATRVLLLLALITASLTLTHCRLVGDRLNGVDVGIFRRKDECLATCQDQFKARNQAEDILHAQNVAACGGNPTCLANEEARHIAAESDSKAQREACMNGCHQQGGNIAP